MNRKKIRYFLQAVLVIPLYCFLYILPIRWASSLGGFFGRNVAYHMPITKVGFKNIQAIYPEKSLQWQQNIIKKSWDNLGRTFFEVPHLRRIQMGTDILIKGMDILEKQDKPILFFSAHFANWEVLAKTAKSVGFPFKRIYRKANNPYVEDFIQQRRGKESGDFIPKGKEGSKKLIKAIKEGHNIGMLLDQKMNNGIESRFLGRMAMSPNAAASLAHRFDIVLIPAYVLRTYSPKGQAQFIVHILPPLQPQETVAETVHAINRIMEGFIKEYPEQWLWVHRRFRDVHYD